MSSGQDELLRKRKRAEDQSSEVTRGKSGDFCGKKAKVDDSNGLLENTLLCENSTTSVTLKTSGSGLTVGSRSEIKADAMSTPVTPVDSNKRKRRQKAMPAVNTLAPSRSSPLVASAEAQSAKALTGLQHGMEQIHGNYKKRSDTVWKGRDGTQVQVAYSQDLPPNNSSLVKHRRSTPHRTGGSEKNQWILSDALGGALLRVDPLFSADEKHMILATENAVQVYACATSLLVTSLSVDGISAYALSASTPSLLYISTRKGQISTWNWLEGKRLNRWSIDSQIVSLASAITDGSGQDTLFTLDKGKKWMITAHKFGSRDDPTKTDLMTLLKHDGPLRSLKVLDRGSVICAATSDGFIVGKRNNGNLSDTTLKGLNFTWREVKCAEAPTCLAVRVVTGSAEPAIKQSKKKSQARTYRTVDIAVGGSTGCVYVYHDILTKLDMNKSLGTETRSAGAPTVRELHWHREAVAALAWSLDGNYVISGGRETVLVLWQLDTGKRQYLPHLESPIQALVVSPRGSSYAVRLGDNSVVVLSTSELKATSNIVGIQSLNIAGSVHPQIQGKTLESNIENSHNLTVKASINPRNLQELILAVPAHQGSDTTTDSWTSSPYIQTFDLNSARHISRQAVTRSNAISTNRGPEGNQLIEPDVRQLQVSSDGRWLATVDEWSPPLRDVIDLSVDNDDSIENVEGQRESQLRFWSWDDVENQWTLNSRITTPHAMNNPLSTGTVLGLATDPSGVSFASIGQDSVVRLWTPTTKLAKGQVVRGDFGQQPGSEVSWKKLFDIPLRKDMKMPSSARVAYTADGSCLAVAQSFTGQGSGHNLVHLIDTDKGVLECSRDNLLWTKEEICDLGFLEHYLILVGRQTIQVWDVTTWEVRAYIPITRNGILAGDQTPAPKLAINGASRTFALVTYDTVNQSAEGGKTLNYNNLRTHLRVYSPFGERNSVSTCLFEATLPRPALAFLSAAGAAGDAVDMSEDLTGQHRGYLILDTNAAVRTVRPKPGRGRQAPPTMPPESDALDVDTTFEAAQPSPLSEHAEHNDDVAMTGADGAEGNNAEPSDRTIVRPEQLADLFDYPAHAPPSMRELARGVMGLFAGGGARVDADDIVMT